MNLKDFISNREKPPELYWSLVIEKGWVQAGIWYIGSGVAEMLNISPPASWEEGSELVGACDAALSSAVAKLPESYTEPSKTVFGVVSNWVKDGEITDEHLAVIKEVCTELSLTPVGFVVLPEAIAHLYKSEEGTPLSAIIVGLGKENLEVSVFKMGNLAGTTSVARSINLTDDVTEGLTRFEGASPLPSRIIIYDGKGAELTEAKDELTTTNWDGEEKVKFLHTPKVEILLSDKKVLATSLAGANEIGDASKVKSNSDLTEKPEPEEVLPSKEEIENVKEPLESVTAEDLGFVVGEDITQKEEPGFKIPEPVHSSVPTYVPLPTPFPKPLESKTSNYLKNTKNLFHQFSSKIRLPHPQLSFGRSKSPLALMIALLVLLFAVGGLYLWIVPKAQVTIFVSPKVFQEELSLKFNTEGLYDQAKAIVPGMEISADVSGEKTKSSSGTKLVGERSKGSVSIANGNGNPIRVATGTILTSTAGLRFVTDSEASVSGQLIPGSPGTATLSVTAADIGAQYNLAKGEIFKVGVFDKSQVAATSQVDFSGGSSQQIAAVSEKDQESLEEDLKQELSTQLAEELAKEVTPDKVFVNDLAAITVSSATFDHKIGDTADTLKLKLTITGTAVAGDKTKLLQYVTDSLKTKIPQGYALRGSEIDFKFTFTGKEDGNLVYTANINANFVPFLSTKDLAKQIVGKHVDNVSEYLSSVPGYSRAEIKLTPPLPGPFKALPRLVKNIKITIASE